MAVMDIECQPHKYENVRRQKRNMLEIAPNSKNWEL